MIVQITSTNPKLSYLLVKNPNTGIQFEPLRKGILYHYFKTPQHYLIFFEDDAEIIAASYPKKSEEQQYLDKSGFISSYCLFDIISKLLSHIIKSDNSKYLKYESKNNEYNYKLFCLLEVTAERNLEIFKKYFKNDFCNIKLEYIKFGKDIYKVTFESNNFFNLIKGIFIFAVYNSIYNNDKILLQDSFVEKVINIVNDLDAPFFIRYLIKKNLIFNKKIFETVKEKLETSNRYKITFVSKDQPWEIRYNFIYQHINITLPFLVDWGFGEGKLINRFKKIFDKVIGIEIDDDMIEKLKWKIENREDYKNVICIDLKDLSQFEDFLNYKDDCVIVISEVIEHLENYNSVANLLLSCIKKDNVKQIILTTPNRNFNKYLGIESDGFRHEDHKFELDRNELIELLDKVILQVDDCDYFIYDVGDKVNDEPMWFGVVIKRY